jgi:hypothetical protein
MPGGGESEEEDKFLKRVREVSLICWGKGLRDHHCMFYILEGHLLLGGSTHTQGNCGWCQPLLLVRLSFGTNKETNRSQLYSG